MKNKIKMIFVLMLFYISTNAQNPKDYTIQISTEIINSPLGIKLVWPLDNNATSYSVYRKQINSNLWSLLANNLSGSITSFTDENVLIGSSFEYKIKKVSNVNAESSIYAGIEVPAIENKGKLILLVDEVHSTALTMEINRLIDDLTGEGWVVLRHNIPNGSSVTSVKTIVQNVYNLDTVNTKAIFILGHVAVPYSGNIAPDGHVPDHLGAWPSDLYYADINGNWTDSTVNNNGANRNENKNIPGDGKFDNSTIPTDVEMQIGRVDFYNLPVFSISETELLRRYLEKNHNYRVKNFSVTKRVLIDDNFGAFRGEAFASNGWRLSSIVGSLNINNSDYFSTLPSNSYQWAFACGGGSYNSISGVGNSTNFTTSNPQSIFNLFFGSYFGDWDSQNNFMRSSLASGTTLVSAWTGRPHWHFHLMGLGENIGLSAKNSQNNSSTYVTNYYPRSIHQTLLGDPTLKNDIVAPVSNVIATASNGDVLLTWSISPDVVLGYYVYKKNDATGFYDRITPTIITTNSFTDVGVIGTLSKTYMVRAIKLENVVSGTYYNLSLGIFNNNLLSRELLNLNAETFKIFPNPLINSEVTVLFYSLENKKCNIKIIDNSGKLVFSKSVLTSVGNNSFVLSDLNFAKGIYTLIIDNVYFKNIIIN